MNHVGQGGAALALYDLIVELKKSYDLEVVVFTGKHNQLNDSLDSIGVENHVAPYKNFMSSMRHPIWLWRIILKIRHDFYLPLAIRSIEKQVNVKEFDIIHTNLNRMDIGAILAHKYKKPHFWHIREHGSGDLELISIYKDIAKYMESFKSRYIVISNSVKKEWMAIGLPQNKTDLIYDGVQTDCLRPDENEHKDRIRVLFLGGYTPAKGQEMLIEAVYKLPPEYRRKISVDFFGNDIGGYKKVLANSIEKYGLADAISLYDYEPDVYEKINTYDIGVNCSKKEGFGRVTVEYMLAGLCTIATNTGANPEIIENMETGFLFEYGNLDELNDILISLIGNPTLIKKVGRHASENVRNIFSMKEHARQIYKEYTGIVM